MVPDVVLLFLGFGGIYLMGDGIGSIAVQPMQPFFWFQLVRLVRFGIGLSLVFLTIFMMFQSL